MAIPCKRNSNALQLTAKWLEAVCFDQSSIESIARQLGVAPAQAQSAMQQALPLLVGGLAHNSASAEGSQALFGALQKDHAGIDLSGLLGAVLGGGASSGSGAGPAILGHIFGGSQQRASQGLGQSSGLGGEGASRLLAMLAPVVMAMLGNMTRQQSLDANALGGMLGQEKQRMQQSGIGALLSSVLDRDGDGKVGLDEMMEAGSNLLGAFGKRS